ncbi:MAG: hypothetical protein U1E83_03410 [Methylotetracoccus sp.]
MSTTARAVAAEAHRYSRLAKDYDIDDETMEDLPAGRRKMHETLLSAMAPADAEAWFGAPAQTCR